MRPLKQRTLMPRAPFAARGSAWQYKRKSSPALFTKGLALILALNLFAWWPCLGAPFAKEFRYTQPDGTTIRLWGQGDEFYAVFETLNGYTVVFNPEIRAYVYARVSADQTVLEPTGALVGQDDPALLGLAKHQRISKEAARMSVRQKYQAWDQALHLSERWAELKARTLGTGPRPLSPPTFQTKGIKCGLTVLIDFEDERATISREDVYNFLNADNYTGFGNNGSVKQYFADNSNGILTFTNVVTLYITIPNSVHPRSFYNDPTKDAFQQCQLLIRDALNVMKRLPNFTNDFLPLFQPVTVDAANKVISANFFVAGNDSGVWSKGIWGQASALSYSVGAQALWPGGKIVDRYQLSPMGDGLDLVVFCHENGHLLCGFPDLYDYDFDSLGGAGTLCIMAQGEAFQKNPSQVCAYLKAAAGWASVVDLVSSTNFQASLSASGPGFNRFYRFRKPGVPTEYFLLENRQRAGRDAEILSAGIAVWHIDEMGNRDDQNLSPNSSHRNYEVTLVQADNRWDLEYQLNFGDPEDCFYAGNSAPGYMNAFSDLTSPSAQWWNGSRSGLDLSDFSTNAETMTFTAKVQPVVIRFDPVDSTVFETQNALFSFTLATALTNVTIQWYKDGAPLSTSSRITGVDSNALAIIGAVTNDAGNYWADITHASGVATTRVARLAVEQGPPLLSTNFSSLGTTMLVPDGLDLTCSGAGIGGTSDSFRFAYQSVSGDFDARVRLLGINMKGAQTRAGLMVRRSLTWSSSHLSVLGGFLPPLPTEQPCSVLARFAETGPTKELLSLLAPLRDTGTAVGDIEVWSTELWLRLKREGDRFTAYRSVDGSNWVWLESVELDLGVSPFVGMALAAGAGASVPAAASFRRYELLTNTAPTLAAFTRDSTATEGTLDTAQVAIYSSRNGPLQASVRFGGTAAYGLDYLPLPAEVTIPSGTNVALLTITPTNNDLPAWPKTVEISLVDQPGLDLVQPEKASVLILDDEQTVGGLKRELYPGIGGFQVSALTRQMTNLNAQSDVGYVTSFETPTNSLQYGEALSGYLVPPETGNYVFYLASDENSELWLSTNKDPANAKLVARVQGFTGFRDYLESGNHSAPIALQQGQYYYVKALHKQDWGADCFSVAWQLPGGLAPTNGSSPIEGKFLAFSLPAARAIQIALRSSDLLDLVCETSGAKVCVLEASTDLQTWQPVWTNTLPARLELGAIDPSSATQPARFYRALLK